MFSTTAMERTDEADIQKLIHVFQNHSLVQSTQENRGLINIITNQKATPELTQDLLHAREMGQLDYEHAVQFYFLKDPSVQLIKRKRRLLTFSEKPKCKKRKSPLAEKQKTVQLCTKRCLKLPQLTNVSVQFIEQPRALEDVHNNPTTGQKSYMTKALSTRYKDITNQALPSGWQQELAILEGMFLINIKPLGKTFEEYAQLLSRRFVRPQFDSGTTEVHILFDDPNHQPFNPKHWEQMRRDNHCSTATHQHLANIEDTLLVPTDWKSLLGCRECKKKLVLYLACKMLVLAPLHMKNKEQKLIIAGPFENDLQGHALSISATGIVDVECQLASTAQETDSRIWRHSTQSPFTKQYIFSPDTDSYIIGLTHTSRNKQIYVELSPLGAKEKRLLNLNKLIDSIERDPDLSQLQPNTLPLILQVVYVSTGCDYISFFAGLGKSSFLKALFTYSEFITSGVPVMGLLSDVTPQDSSKGYLAFLRLVGTTYFQKYRSKFPSKSPIQLYHSCHQEETATQHIQWLDKIREQVWQCTSDEKDLIPSHTALKLHWLRTTWVLSMWNQASLPVVNLLPPPPPTDYGWSISEDGGLKIEWDTEEHVLAIRNQVQHLIRGCKCKKGCQNN